MPLIYHTLVNRFVLALNFAIGSLLIYLVWAIRQPVFLIYNVSFWADDRLIDLEESIYERAWVARSRLPAWKDE